ncbi:hypothetical protein IAR50_002372 [Cryptococcus sp. DSM 104548]
MKLTLTSAVVYPLLSATCSQALTIVSPVNETGWWSKGKHLVQWKDYDPSKTFDISLTFPDSTTRTIFSDVPAEQQVAVFTSNDPLPLGDYSISFSVKPDDGDEEGLYSAFSLWNGTEPPLSEEVEWIIYGAAGRGSSGWGDSSASTGISKDMVIPFALSFAGLAMGAYAFL